MKSFTVTVEQIDTFAKKLKIKANSKEEAEAKAKSDMEADPMGFEKNAYQGTELTIAANEE